MGLSDFSTAILRISQLALLVHLGCSKEERQFKQEVWIDVSLEFSTLPNACLDDRISSCVCYKSLCDKILLFAEKASFNTIERLAYAIYEIITDYIIKSSENPFKHAIEVDIHKKNTPTTAIREGAFFKLRINNDVNVFDTL
ncbi:D-erythro-7,8-dihydroneopterin triphosphate 2'-epimerase [Candidatus Fokinia solitaria]|uniref:D-erythro-7,8-dihydroneopterin triphosphate 2'-epimerase n=1 Tax=Candidatus Fokinia solitaria TaxID=1802984 RepID=A0A2U8BSD3_9RICK|nr:dihydroneopterin aldolase [Candidatus Fokinia solitaria]AWD33208.1 D-erythro-7,8-dihydroneopterin triphosphate 2'-epimerase [Candidatus Fokinia solitaria]